MLCLLNETLALRNIYTGHVSFIYSTSVEVYGSESGGQSKGIIFGY